MLSSGVESAGWIPSKLFQYMASGTPILGLVPEGDVAQIIRETNTGTVIGPNDVEQIKTVIRAAYSAFRRGETHAEPNWNAVENYEGCRLTERLADCLTDVVASSRVPADRSPQSLIGR
jgi:glycosyltransferase involved in cell wall biosynthesis